jgi:hypothetical protein
MQLTTKPVKSYSDALRTKIALKSFSYAREDIYPKHS